VPDAILNKPGRLSDEEFAVISNHPVKGEAIPLQGRILAVADVFDAMSSGRAYRPAHQLDTVLGELRDGAGVRYDPRVIEAFFRSTVWSAAARR